MGDKWPILAVLVLARLVMGVQFESIGALGPLLKAQGLDYGRLGILVGAYLAPGFLVALPGGVAVQRLGERTALLLCLLLMAVGGTLDLVPDWNVRLAARFVAGAGSVAGTVAATKMLADRFSGKEFGLAMAAIAAAWPAGIALSLLLLPPVAQAYGLPSASALVPSFAAVSLLLCTALPKRHAHGSPVSTAFPGVLSTVAVCVAGVGTGLANASFAIVFAFGPALLAERGFMVDAAASRVSVVLWTTIAMIPIGGLVAARRGAGMALTAVCVVLGGACLFAVPRLDPGILVFAATGICAGLPGASMIGMPSWVLPPRSRAIGMGIFYSVFYAVMLTVPPIAGVLARGAGDAGVAFDVAALCAWIALPLYVVFACAMRVLAGRPVDPVASAEPAEQPA